MTHVRLGDTIRVQTLLAVFETYSPPAVSFSSKWELSVFSAISVGVLPHPGCWNPSSSDVNQVDLRTAVTVK